MLYLFGARANPILCSTPPGRSLRQWSDQSTSRGADISGFATNLQTPMGRNRQPEETLG